MEKLFIYNNQESLRFSKLEGLWVDLNMVKKELEKNDKISTLEYLLSDFRGFPINEDPNILYFDLIQYINDSNFVSNIERLNESLKLKQEKEFKQNTSHLEDFESFNCDILENIKDYEEVDKKSIFVGALHKTITFVLGSHYLFPIKFSTDQRVCEIKVLNKSVLKCWEFAYKSTYRSF